MCVFRILPAPLPLLDPPMLFFPSIYPDRNTAQKLQVAELAPAFGKLMHLVWPPPKSVIWDRVVLRTGSARR
jgi:hypothetical protein